LSILLEGGPQRGPLFLLWDATAAKAGRVAASVARLTPGASTVALAFVAATWAEKYFRAC